MFLLLLFFFFFLIQTLYDQLFIAGISVLP